MIEACKLIIAIKLGMSYLVDLLSLLGLEEKKLSNETTGTAVLVERCPLPDEIHSEQRVSRC